MKNRKLLQFESKKEACVFLGVAGALLIVIGLAFYPAVKKDADAMEERSHMASRTPQEYYSMFRCSCCGSPIDAGCCGMAEERKDYVDTLMLEGLEEDEIVYRMVKRFGYDVLMDPSKEQDVKEYIEKLVPEDSPRIAIDADASKLGVVKQSEGIVSAEFTIENAGKSDLVIEGLDSSCMCTTASLVYKGKESQRFGMSMHGDNPKNFRLVMPPGEKAKLKVYYDPNAHGKQEEPRMDVTREITIISNDPINFQKKVRLELTQVP